MTQCPIPPPAATSHCMGCHYSSISLGNTSSVVSANILADIAREINIVLESNNSSSSALD